MIAETPYKILFCVGTLFALLGSWCWIFVRLGWMPYPINIHAEWMVLGFLLSFASGFLMTAIPRFLNAPVCKQWELIVAALIALLPFGGLWLSAECVAYGGILQLIWLAVYVAQRFFKREFMPPPSFLFLPLGILGGIVGCIVLTQNPSAPGRILVFEGMMLAFVFGIGSRLVTALLGWAKPIQIELGKKKFWQNSDYIVAIEGFVFLLGMIFHGVGKTQVGDSFWAAVALSIGIRLWKIYRLPVSRTVLSIVLWVSTHFAIFGLCLVAILPVQRIHMMHFVYISGMGLMTLMIGTRVILSHGGYSLQLEFRSKSIVVIGALFLIAAATRVSAPYIPNELYFTHLAYAGGTLSLGILVWTAEFLRRIGKI